MKQLPLAVRAVALSIALLAILLSANPASASSRQPDHILASDETLANDQQMYSPNGKYMVAMQSDNNLVVYSSNKAIWSTGTHGTPGGPARLRVQGDGNLVIYVGKKAIWSTGTHNGIGIHLVMQDDGNLVAYRNDGSGPVWASRQGRIEPNSSSAASSSPTNSKKIEYSAHAENVQRLLRRQGVSVTVDGLWGPKTTAAVKEFQRLFGITVDGKVGPVTMASLEDWEDPLPKSDAPEPRTPEVKAAPAGRVTRAPSTTKLVWEHSYITGRCTWSIYSMFSGPGIAGKVVQKVFKVTRDGMKVYQGVKRSNALKNAFKYCFQDENLLLYPARKAAEPIYGPVDDAAQKYQADSTSCWKSGGVGCFPNPFGGRSGP